MRAVLVGLCCLLLGACSWWRSDGYKGDGPPRRPAIDVAKVEDAVPRFEHPSRYGNKPYQALGKTYYPTKTARGYQERGVASWYGRKFHGRRTSNGETYNMYAMTAAHRTLPLPTYVRVKNLRNGKAVIVRINDRGPFLHNRIIDLSYAAAYKLGIIETGTGLVEVGTVFPGSTPTRVYATRKLVTSSPGMYVQLGAFASQGNAKDLRARLKRDGFVPTVTRIRKDGRDLYRVRSGPLHTVAEADRLIMRMERFGYTPSLVIE